MNKRGFTLIELLGVIVLLGILSMIAVPAIDNALKSGRDKLNETQKNQIIKGAKDFFAQNTYCLPGSDNSKCTFKSVTCVNVNSNVSTITLSCLKGQGYLPSSITNLSNDKDYEGTTVVKVTKTNSNYNYSVEG